MAYEHDQITGNRPRFEERQGFRREGSGGPGLAIALGAIIIALIVAIYAFSGGDTTTVPPATIPAETVPAAPAGQPAADPAVDPASDPAGAIPGVEPMVPVEPEQPAPAPAE